MIHIKRLILLLLQTILGREKSIRAIEYIKGLYRYPYQMIGRISSEDLQGQKTDILVFAAHPDDEILGLSATLQRYKQLGKTVTVVYVTNGSSRDQESWQRGREQSEHISKLRYGEGVQALSLIGIPPEHIFCLGFPDAGSHRYLQEIAQDVQLLMESLGPEKVYVHCIEGGHHDHDLVSLVVKLKCRHLNFHHVFEWAEYSPSHPMGTKDMAFPPAPPIDQEKEIAIKLSNEELVLKREMLACHKSQQVEPYFTQGEIIRKANLLNPELELAAHSQVPNESWSNLVDKFIKRMA